MYELKNVSKMYLQGEQSVTALSDVNLNFTDKGVIALVGESGCGKTTLLNILAGFDEVSSGNILFEGNLLDIHNEDIIKEYHRQDVGFIFQDYNVIEELSVWNNVELPLDIFDMDETVRKERIAESLAKVGLLEEKNKKVSKLSGGQKQRVAIARAYAKKPKVILADEPTGNLDYENSVKIFKMLKDISEDVLVIVVTHDKNMAANYADRIITILDGKISDDIEVENGDVNVKVCDDEKEENVTDFTELMTFIKLHKKDKYTLKISKKDNLSKEKKSKTCIERFDRKSLELKILRRLSSEIINRRKIRQFLSIVIFAITISFLLTMFNFVFYDEHKVVTDYLEKYDENEIIVKKTKDSLLESVSDSDYVFVSKEIKDFLLSIPDVTVFRQFNDRTFSNSNAFVQMSDVGENTETQGKKEFNISVNIRLVSDEMLNSKYHIEKLNKDEIIISEKLAKDCGLNKNDIGKSFYLNGKEIILREIVADDTTIIYASYELSGYMFNKDKNQLNLWGNFLNSKSLFTYANTSVTICDVGKTNDLELIEKIGKEKSNVILSEQFISQWLDIDDKNSIIGKQFDLIDLYQKRYGNAFSEKMNLYDYFGQRVTVVGIEDFEGEVYVQSQLFNTILEDYYDVYVYDNFGCYSTKWNNIIKDLHDNNFFIDDNNLDDVYDVKHIKPVIIKYIALLLGVLLILTCFLMVTIIGYSIKDNSKLIGILKSLGICKEDIKILFSIQPIIIIATSFAIAFVLVLLLVAAINIEFIQSSNIRAYIILPLNIGALVFAMIITIVIGVLTIIIPLKDMDKKTIIENVKY